MRNSNSCDLKIHENDFVSNNEFGVIVEINHYQSRNTGCRTYPFGNTTLTLPTSWYYTYIQNFVVYSNHNLDFLSSEQISSTGVYQGHSQTPLITTNPPQFTSNGGWALYGCLLYTSPSPRDRSLSRMPSSA